MRTIYKDTFTTVCLDSILSGIKHKLAYIEQNFSYIFPNNFKVPRLRLYSKCKTHLLF